jgi:hypothetical protein
MCIECLSMDEQLTSKIKTLPLPIRAQILSHVDSVWGGPTGTTLVLPPSPARNLACHLRLERLDIEWIVAPWDAPTPVSAA